MAGASCSAAIVVSDNRQTRRRRCRYENDVEQILLGDGDEVEWVWAEGAAFMTWLR
jgi:hypothetical protein